MEKVASLMKRELSPGFHIILLAQEHAQTISESFCCERITLVMKLYAEELFSARA